MPKGMKQTPEQIVAILRRVEQGDTAEAVTFPSPPIVRGSRGPVQLLPGGSRQPC